MSVLDENCVKTESRLCTFVTCGQQHLANLICICVLQQLTLTSFFLVTKVMEIEFFELCLRNEPLQKLFMEKVQSSIGSCKRQMNKNYFYGLGTTALFAGGRQRDNFVYAAQRNRVLSRVETEHGRKLGASIWRMKPFKDICNISLINKQRESESDSQENELFKNSVALCVYENFCWKNVMIPE